MRFAYARTGGPLLDWSGPTPPSPTRAGETRSLGSWSPPSARSKLARVLQRRGVTAVARRTGSCAPGCWPEGSSCYCPQSPSIVRAFGSLDIPRPGAPEVVAGYQSPQPGAAVIQLGSAYPWDQQYPGQTMSGYMPEGAARAYGQTMLSDAAPTAPTFNMGLVRKASVIAAAYHGVKRHNGSVLWGLLWGLAAYVTPLYGVLMPAIGIAQGFGQAKVRSNPAMGGSKRRSRKRMQARLYRKAKRKSHSRRKTVRRRSPARTTRWGTRRGY